MNIQNPNVSDRISEITERLQQLAEQVSESAQNATLMPQTDSFERSAAPRSPGASQNAAFEDSASYPGDIGSTDQMVSSLIDLMTEVLPQLQATQNLSSSAATNPASTSSGSAYPVSSAQSGSAGGMSSSSVPYVVPPSSSANNASATTGNHASSTTSQGTSQSSGAGAANLNTEAASGADNDTNTLDTLLSKLIDAIEALGAELSSSHNSTTASSAAANQASNSAGNNYAANNASSSYAANSNKAQPSTSSYANTAGSSSNTNNQGAQGAASQVYAGSGSLAANKQQVWQLAKQNGATDEQAATLLAIGMLETNDLTATQRDAKKDGTASANYSAFNMNKDMLQKLGWKPGTGPDLNDPANMSYAVGLAIAGMKTFGTNGFLAYNRGGSTGFADGSSYGVKEYQAAIQSAAKTLLADPSKITNSQRIATYVPYT